MTRMNHEKGEEERDILGEGNDRTYTQGEKSLVVLKDMKDLRGWGKKRQESSWRSGRD